jgi:hypothetical protein
MRKAPACLVVLLLMPCLLRAVEPARTLLRLVPDQMGVCLLVEDGRGHAATFLASPFVKRFTASRFGKELLGTPEVVKLKTVDDFLQANLGISAAALRDEILGDAVVLAFRPGPPDHPEQDSGIFFLSAREPQLLARLLERITKLQKDSGELREVHERTHRGRSYVQAVGKNETTYYVLAGPTLAASSDEKLLQAVIDRLDPPDRESIYEKRFKSLRADSRLVSLWIDPRPFTPLLRQQAGSAKGAQLAAFNAFMQYWNAIDCVGLFVTHGENLELTFAVEGRQADLPAAAAGWFTGVATEEGDLSRRWPSDAFLMLNGRIDLARTLDCFGQFLDAPTRQALRVSVDQKVGTVLGRDSLADVVPAVGPEWGLCLAPPPKGGTAWYPEVLAAVQVSRNAAQPNPELVILNALNSWAALAVYAHNLGKPGSMSLRSISYQGSEIKYLDDDKEFPPGVQPAFACRDRYLVLGSSPKAVERFATGAVAPAASRPFFRLACKPLVAYLRDRRQELASYAAARSGVAKETAVAGIDRLVEVLELVDSLEIRSKRFEGGFAWSVELRLAEPLR